MCGKKDGELVMLEHVLSKNKLIALWQHILNPFTRYFFGFNVNRDTRANIEKAGLTITSNTNCALGDVVRLFRAQKEK